MKLILLLITALNVNKLTSSNVRCFFYYENVQVIYNLKELYPFTYQELPYASGEQKGKLVANVCGTVKVPAECE